MKKILLVFLLIVSLISGAYCDIAPVRSVGSTIIPVENKQVQMESERVSIVVVEDFRGIVKPARDILVEAEFRLKNLGEEHANLEIGFPFPDYKEGSDKYSKPHNFEVIVNGKRVKTEKKNGNIEDYGLWFVWKVEIPVGKTINVITRYRLTPSLPLFGGIMDPYRYCRYILKTGKYWHGPIGHARINLDYNPKVVDIYRVYPCDYQERYGQIVWEWQNLKPTEDISFEIWGKSMLETLIQKDPKEITEDDIKASSTLLLETTYAPMNAFDGNPETAWSEGAGGAGIGEWLWLNLLKMDKNKKNREFYLERIGIVNGCAVSEEQFKEYSSVRTATIEFSDGTRKNIALQQNTQLQWFEISPPVPTGSIKIIIDSVYPGRSFTDTYISDIYLRGTYYPEGRARNEGH